METQKEEDYEIWWENEAVMVKDLNLLCCRLAGAWLRTVCLGRYWEGVQDGVMRCFVAHLETLSEKCKG